MSYYQTIYDTFRVNGLTEAGALGFLGNWDCESNCEPFRLQGDFSAYRSLSHQYVADVENGKISMNTFAHDSKGFGLAQWTYWSRKKALYDFWKQSGTALDDAAMQTRFAVSELQSEYQGLLGFLRTSNDLYECTKRICTQYERPAYNNIDARYQAAIRIKNEIDLNDWQDDTPTPTTTPGPEPANVYWPPRTIDSHCGGWPEVGVLQSVLNCRGYLSDAEVCTPFYENCIWTDSTTNALKKFQRDNGLTADGCCGPMTWRKLLEM